MDTYHFITPTQFSCISYIEIRVTDKNSFSFCEISSSESWSVCSSNYSYRITVRTKSRRARRAKAERARGRARQTMDERRDAKGEWGGSEIDIVVRKRESRSAVYDLDFKPEARETLLYRHIKIYRWNRTSLTRGWDFLGTVRSSSRSSLSWDRITSRWEYDEKSTKIARAKIR